MPHFPLLALGHGVLSFLLVIHEPATVADAER